MRARGFALGGQPEGGLPLIEEAIEIVGEGNVLYPEFALLKGDLLLALADADGAEPWLRSASDVAANVGLRMPQLRAAARLTRLLRAAGRRPDGTGALLGVYRTFTEWFDTRDLADARAILDEVGARAV